MKGPIIEQQQMEAGGISGGKMIKKELRAWGVEPRQFHKEALPRPRFHCAVQGETLEAVRRGQERLDPAGGDAAAHDGQQTTATFILRPHPPLPLAALPGAVYMRSEVRAERDVKLRNVLRGFFGWERRGALGLACN